MARPLPPSSGRLAMITPDQNCSDAIVEDVAALNPNPGPFNFVSKTHATLGVVEQLRKRPFSQIGCHVECGPTVRQCFLSCIAIRLTTKSSRSRTVPFTRLNWIRFFCRNSPRLNLSLRVADSSTGSAIEYNHELTRLIKNC